MRVLKPQEAQKRKEKVLNWAIYNYVVSCRPISSEMVAESGDFDISSATIRNILKELEESGYLHQMHTSGGRVPTDKGYRSYVNYIMDIQKAVSVEKEKVMNEYDRKIEQFDILLKQTSRILSNLSKCAGFVMSADIEDDSIRKIDLIWLKQRSFLMIILMHSGIIRHVPFILDSVIDKKALALFSSELNKHVKDVPLSDVAGIIWDFSLKNSAKQHYEAIAEKIYEYFYKSSDQSESVYLEGLGKITECMEEDGIQDFKNIIKILEEKERFRAMLQERLKACSEKKKKITGDKTSHAVEVTIGSENDMREFKNFSVVSSSYCIKNRPVGLVGILGYKRMEYPKMISIVDTVSCMIEDILSEWEDFHIED
ncbi:MAG: heat-inducible transcription repressor HrcA [Elusimicrobia bacterium]|nr:heat-inducible transcription repressor HrcA [Elusimicrobiota bacterium]